MVDRSALAISPCFSVFSELDFIILFILLGMRVGRLSAGLFVEMKLKVRQIPE